MGLTKRPDSYYVEFRVIDSPDGKSLALAGVWRAHGSSGGKLDA
jgi:hypothetical protein